jgi:hypothetical protein
LAYTSSPFSRLIPTPQRKTASSTLEEDRIATKIVRDGEAQITRVELEVEVEVEVEAQGLTREVLAEEDLVVLVVEGGWALWTMSEGRSVAAVAD